MEVWDIFVPRHWDVKYLGGMISSEEISREHHLEFDKEVCKLAGGMMLKEIVEGKWKMQEEEVIQVRVACSEDNIKHLAEFAKKHYKQEAIMVFKRPELAYLF